MKPTRTQTPVAAVLAARLREAEDRAETMRAGLESACAEIEHLHQLVARAGVNMALGAGAVDVAREILSVLKGWERLERVAERIADRAAAAEVRLERARAALPALQALAAKGSPAARDAVATMTAALGDAPRKAAA